MIAPGGGEASAAARTANSSKVVTVMMDNIFDSLLYDSDDGAHLYHNLADRCDLQIEAHGLPAARLQHSKKLGMVLTIKFGCCAPADEGLSLSVFDVSHYAYIRRRVYNHRNQSQYSHGSIERAGEGSVQIICRSHKDVGQ